MLSEHSYNSEIMSIEKTRSKIKIFILTDENNKRIYEEYNEAISDTEQK